MKEACNDNGIITNTIKELESKLQAAEQRLNDLTQTSMDWFWETDEQMRFTQVSHRYFEITGVPPNQVIGKTRFELVPLKEQQRRAETWKKHKQETDERRPFRNFEYGIKGVHGLTRYVRINGKPVFSSDGIFKGYVGTGTDETDRIEAQIALEQTQIELLQSEKFASIGQLAAGAAHEINTPIGFITLNLQTLQEYTSDLLQLIDGQDRLLQKHNLADNAALNSLRDDIDIDYLKEDLPDLLQQSSEGINKISQIVHGLQEYASPVMDQNSLRTTVDINNLLTKASESILLSCKVKEITLRTDYAVLPHIQGQENQLKQLFASLMQNAEQAITDHGEISIVTHLSNDDKSVQITIKDTGCGMDAETLNKIFDPFFTTREVGSGTGLGLSMAQGIVQSHNGTIKVKSELNVGTVIVIELPAEG